MSIDTAPSSGTLRCARHPNTATVLRCGRCETPICPRCLVATPVGARCPTCAGVKRFPMLLKPIELVRSVGFGLGVAAIGTLILNLVPLLGVLGPLGYAAVGFGVGEAVAVGAHRKRLPLLGPVAVACLFAGYEIGVLAVLVLLGRGGFEPQLLLVPIVALFRGLNLIAGLLIGALLAWMRVR
jgi:hypothetical protein